ncbi:hypothetical protein [Sagittula stellata]|uniref:Uncharacterized protein n=1 Tax=Sagittula stellata (strain ATCC 700073 / DSM 11524 / E-37) TaxID=388399 RepID=A3JYD7_SAGS3|nr:hypothetical protein [Sagittula stellata]EBA10523.1 hypothetical protein SSE37_20997 [Sagittula stellata E-37]
MTQRRLAGTFIGLAMMAALPSLAWAEGVCANKPSKLAGAAAERAGTVLSGAGDVAKSGAKAAGNYMLMHPGQSVKLVTGAAGTVSSATTAAGGVGGLAASVTAVVTAPVTLVVGAVAFAAVGSYEGLCYFQVERVTDPDEVRAIIDSITETDPLVWTRNTNKGPVMVLAGPDGEQVYPIRKLYIADGMLKVRDWGLNSTLGPVAYVQPEEEE